MIRVCILTSLIILLSILAYHSNSAYFKKLYEDIVSPKGWHRVEIVDEKRLLEDMFAGDIPCGLVEMLTGATACVISFLIGWRVNNYRSLYGKEANNGVVEGHIKKQNEIEKRIEALIEKFDEFEEKYLDTMSQLDHLKELQEQISTERDSFQQNETKMGIEMSSQTSNSLSTGDLHFEKSNVETSVNKLMCDSSTQVEQTTGTHHPVLLAEEEHTDENNVMLCSDNKDDQFSTSIEEERNVNDEKKYDCNNSTHSSSETIVCKEETYPIEIDIVQCSSADEGKENSDLEQYHEKSSNISETKENVTILDVVDHPTPLTTGSGEGEDTSTCKVSQDRQIPLYQGLRKGTELKPRIPRYHNSFEGRNTFTMNQKVADPGVPSRTSTPQNYSSAPPEVADTTRSSPRKKKQRNYNYSAK